MVTFPLLDEEHIFNKNVISVSLVGTLHDTRWRWNPFSKSNEMSWNERRSRWEWRTFLTPRSGRHGDGVIACRMVINHNMRRVLKSVKSHSATQWRVRESEYGERLENIALRILDGDEYIFSLSKGLDTFQVEALNCGQVEALSGATDFQLNGFVWDGLDVFAKFDERMEGRTFASVADNTWQIAVDLHQDGGIDFRRDGIYQFLISRHANEDLGLGALNQTVTPDGSEIQLIEGTGFGSSHGTSRHSAPTIKVPHNGRYRFTLKKSDVGYILKVDPSSKKSKEAVKFLNNWKTIHLLGNVHKSAGFDPTKAETQMLHNKNQDSHELRLHLARGDYVVNFGFGGELFLDTMGLGCWLSSSRPGELRGVGWHGKPNESNICFRVCEEGDVEFRYYPDTDIFSIVHESGEGALEQTEAITQLSIVGSFDHPLKAWEPTAEENLMTHLDAGRFERYIFLASGKKVEYKYVANRSNWLLVFADYELDGYGHAYGGEMNPNPFDSGLQDLRSYGHLTTHGDPPALQYTPTRTGLHRFLVDLRTGAYGVIPVE